MSAPVSPANNRSNGYPTLSRHLVAFAAGAGLILGGLAHAEPGWLAWGGPTADFKVPAAPLSDSWPETGPRELWSRDLGPGYASILADGGQLYTVYRRGDRDVAIAIDAATGKTIWEQDVPAPAREGQATDYGSGPHAAPLLHGGNLYTISASGILHAFAQKDGTPAWSHDLVKDYGTAIPYFGYAAAPIAHGGRIIVMTGGEHAAIGLDPATGEEVWKSEGLAISYATPLVVDVGGEQQLLFMTPTEVAGLSLADGSVRWRHAHQNQWDTNCIGPWWGEDGLLFVSSMGEAGSRTLRLTRRDGATTAEEVSANTRVKFAHSTAVRLGTHIYGADGDELVAYNVTSGEVTWREEGYKKANLVAVGDRLVAIDDTGKLSLLTATPEKLTVHATHQLLTKPAWTAPTILGSRLYVRDQGRMVALDLGVATPATQPANAE